MSIAPPVVESQDPAAVGAWYALFIQTFPEFSNTALYPITTVNAWIVPAVEMMNQCRFGAQYTHSAQESRSPTPWPTST